MVHKNRPLLTDVLGVILIVALLYGQGNLMGDPGVGWHLLAGKWMSEHVEILRLDPFLFQSATSQAGGGSTPWIHDQWLSDILFWQVFQFGGVPLVLLLVAFVSVLPWTFVLPPLLYRRPISEPLLFVLTFLVTILASIQWFARPVIFSFLLFSVVYRVAESWVNLERRPSRYFPLLFLLWANLHGGFVLGLFLIGVAGALVFVTRPEERKFSVGMVAASTLLTLVNPWGIYLWKSVLSLASSPFFLRLNVEWLSPSLLDPFFLPLTLGAAVFLVLLARSKQQSLSLFDSLVLAVFFALSLLHRRYVPFFGLVAVVPFLELVAGYWPSRRTQFPSRTVYAPLTLGFIVFLTVYSLMTSRLPGLPDQAFIFPSEEIRQALAPLAADKSEKKVFHSPDHGGVLSWLFWPDLKVSIDDRNQIQSPELYLDCLEVIGVKPRWKEILEKGDYGWAVLGESYPITRVLEADPAWIKRGEAPRGELVLFQKLR